MLIVVTEHSYVAGADLGFAKRNANFCVVTVITNFVVTVTIYTKSHYGRAIHY